MGMLCEQLETAPEIIRLRLRVVSTGDLVEPLLGKAHVRQTGRQQSRIDGLRLVFAAGGVAPFVGQHGQLVPLIQRVDDEVPVVHIPGLPGAEVLIHTNIGEGMAGGIDAIQHAQGVFTVTGDVDAASGVGVGHMDAFRHGPRRAGDDPKGIVIGEDGDVRLVHALPVYPGSLAQILADELHGAANIAVEFLRAAGADEIGVALLPDSVVFFGVEHEAAHARCGRHHLEARGVHAPDLVARIDVFGAQLAEHSVLPGEGNAQAHPFHAQLSDHVVLAGGVVGEHDTLDFFRCLHLQILLSPLAFRRRRLFGPHKTPKGQAGLRRPA